MRIGLNATCFNDRPSGANQRFRLLYGTLIRRNPQHEFLIYEPVDHPVAGWFADLPNVVARPTPLPSTGRIARTCAGLGFWRRTLKRDTLDLFETFHLPLVSAPCPTLLTIHDLRPVALDVRLPLRLLAGMVLHHGFAHAAHVIAVSDAVAREIEAFRPGTRVTTIYNGVDAGVFAVTSEAISSVRRRLSLPERYMLTVGHLEERKNLPMLLDSVALLRDRGNMVPLVIVGRDGGQRAIIADRITAQGLDPLVTLIEDADDGTVRALYAGCALVVAPSRYEGFGIALIEAMAARRPLVTSDTEIFRELTQGQGRMFPPNDVAGVADAIERVWCDPVEQKRLVAYGDRRVQDFNFDRLADRIAQLYARVAAGG